MLSNENDQLWLLAKNSCHRHYKRVKVITYMFNQDGVTFGIGW